ncbi:hypothetical protein MMC21_002152 [Puttea exsequens]|nr:hypothetical protein [Puttea exsequens]
MAALKKRSLSDMQDTDRAPPKEDANDTYRMMVLRFEETEDEVDQRFLQTALDLGINISQSPKTTLDLITNNVASLELNPAPSEPAMLSSPRAPESTHTASDESIEQQRHRKTPSLTATSITSVSISSASSKKSNILKVRKGFRRISRISRRKTLSVPMPDVPPRLSSRLQVLRPGMQPRPITADQIPTISNPHLQTHALTTDQIHLLVLPQDQNSSVIYDRPPPPPPQSPPPPPPRNALEGIVSRQRSTSNPVLKRMRTTQLQEQLRFISFEASQHRLMRTRQIQHQRDVLSQYQQHQRDVHARQAEALTSLEHRHLSAEVDLNKTLEVERQACDTRLKHMQAYCSPRSKVPGMPQRVVTKADYLQLEQQYHNRNGMDNLHESRIKVLRERQGKQLERIMAKQEAELESLEKDFEQKNEDQEARFRSEERQLQQEFAERKKRLVKRWDLAEAIERRKLELQTGDDYGPLPPIKWSDDGGTDRNSKGKERESDLPDVDLAYDAMNMI